MIGLSRSSYYYQSGPSKKLLSDFDLKIKIEQIQQTFPGYGYRRIYQHLLKEDGIRVNSKRLKRVMKNYGLYSCLKKWMRPRGSKTSIDLRYPNLIKGLKLTAPNQVWAVDITYIRLRKEFIYLSAVLDIYTRKVVGWAISRSLEHEFCLQAMAIAIEKENPPKGIIHHSDRGVQYVCEPYVRFLKEHGFEISMSLPGSPRDNAFIERFFKTLKWEEIYFRNYEDVRDVIKRLPNFIDEVYNKKRMHSSLGYLSPEEYECKILKLETADRPVQKIWGRTV